MPKLKRTLLVAGLMGAGLVWLTSSKKGKALRDKMFDAAADIYDDTMKKWKKLEVKYRSSKNMYTQIARETVEEYLAQHPTLGLAKDMLVKMVVAQWENLANHVKDKAEENKKAATAAARRRKK